MNTALSGPTNWPDVGNHMYGSSYQMHSPEKTIIAYK